MKKIILLFFTFLGICCCFAQDNPINTDSIVVTPKLVTNILPLKTDSAKSKEKSSALIFPNPAKNKIEITLNGFEPGYVKIQLLNFSGKIVREEKRLLFSNKETIIFMFSETPGLYYLLLKQGAQVLKNKLIIQ